MFVPSLFAAQIQIHAVFQEGLLIRYDVYTWNGKDNAMIITKYSIPEAQTKFGKLLDFNEEGTSQKPDRIFLNYDDQGNLVNVVAQVTSVTAVKFEEAPRKNAADLSTQAQADAVTTKDDIEQKTGKDIGGGDIKTIPK